MLLQYKYHGESHCLLINWTSTEGKSTAFRDVTQKAAERHGFEASGYIETAEHLDTLADKLYELIYAFTNEYDALPYDPRFQRLALLALSNIKVSLNPFVELAGQGHETLLARLFMDVTGKLQETVDVYLEERAYQCKYRQRRRKLGHQYIETTPSEELSFEFEDVLIQMTEISRQLDCLSETQRRRLVKHVFLKYTLQEIANQEGVGKSKVHRSVTEAVNKIKEQLG